MPLNQKKMKKFSLQSNKIITNTSENTVAGMAQCRSRKTLFSLLSLGEMQRTKLDLIKHIILYMRNAKNKVGLDKTHNIYEKCIEQSWT